MLRNVFQRIGSRAHDLSAGQLSTLGFGVACVTAAGVVMFRRFCAQRAAADPRATWFQLCQRLEVPEKIASVWWRRLDEHYGESHRHYHKMSHIQQMLQLQQDHSALVAKPLTMQLAIFFHDAIYNPHSSQNEKDSALLFKLFADEVVRATKKPSAWQTPEEAGAAPPTVKFQNVFDWIVETAKHSPAPDADEALKLFIDIDMSILGTPWPTYADYCAKIRKEYEHHPQVDYCLGRAKVLETFLAQPVFCTTIFRRKYESQARSNIQREIAILKKLRLVVPEP